MLVDPVDQGMKDAASLVVIFVARIELALELIALEAGVDQIVVAVVAAVCDRMIMVDSERSARVSLRDTAIAAATLVALPCGSVFGMGHTLILDAQVPACFLAKCRFQTRHVPSQLSPPCL
jgi:hypothetical protein